MTIFLLYQSAPIREPTRYYIDISKELQLLRNVTLNIYPMCTITQFKVYLEAVEANQCF